MTMKEQHLTHLSIDVTLAYCSCLTYQCKCSCLLRLYLSVLSNLQEQWHVVRVEQALFQRISASSAKRCTEAAARRVALRLRLTQMEVDMIWFG